MDFDNKNEHGFPDPTISPEDNAPDIMPSPNSVDLNKNSYNNGADDPFNYNPNAPQGQFGQQPYANQQQQQNYGQQQQYGQQPQTTYRDAEPGYRMPPPAGFGRPADGGYQAPPDGVYGGSQFAYGQPYRNYPTGLATASLVIGIVSIVFFYFFAIAFPLLILPILGLIFGIVYKTKKFPVSRGISTAGIICNIIGLILPILLYILIFILFMNADEIIEDFKINNPEQYEQIQEEIDDQLGPMIEQNPMLRDQFNEIFEEYPALREFFEDALD